MKKLAPWLVVVLVVLCFGISYAQAPSAPQFKASDEQNLSLRLKNLKVQQDSILLQQAAMKLKEYQTLQEDQKDFEAMSVLIKQQNKWADTVTFAGFNADGTSAWVDNKPPEPAKK